MWNGAEIRWPDARSIHKTALALAFAVAACGGENPPSGPNPDPDPVPQAGLVQASTATTGDDLDPDGYTAAVDGNAGRSIGPNGVITFTDVSAGQHQVELTELAANCAVLGDNPALVSVTAGETAQVSFAVSCVATTGGITIAAVTTGSFLDPNGYVLAVDAGQGQSLDIGATVTLTSQPVGDHSIELSNVAGNCAVAGANPLTAAVVAGAIVEVTFDVVCGEPAPGKLAFLSARGGNPQLEVFVMDGAGEVVTQVTQMGAQKWEVPGVRMSPDGTRILFLAGEQGQRDLWVVNVDGTGLFKVTNAGIDGISWDANWSPDGTQVAYRVGGEGAWVISASGGAPIRISDFYVFFLDWSPDGSKIAFGAFLQPDGSDNGLFVVNPDGSGLQRLASSEGDGTWYSLKWSPDGSRIAYGFRAPLTDPHINIYLVNPDGSGVTRLTSGLGWDAQYPQWSPDGSKIAFVSRGLWVMNADGTGQGRLLTYPNPDVKARHPHWSPDGTTIAFTGAFNGDWDIFTIRPDGSGFSDITNDRTPEEDYLGSWAP